MEKRIYVPTIYTSGHLQQLLTILNQFLTDSRATDIILDFSKCTFLAQNAVAVIGGMASFLELHGSSLTLDLETLVSKININLAQNGLLNHLGYPHTSWDGNSIPFRHDLLLDKEAIACYLNEHWLGKGWLNISKELKEHIVCKVIEIYGNAFDHSHSDLGVFSCGQYYPNKKQLKLTILDLGVGIPANVRKFQAIPDLPEADAIKWAFQQGNSTKLTPKMARGNGLDIIKSFIQKNQGGKLEIYSHGGIAKITQDNDEYGRQDIPFQGTIVNINLVCDSKYYLLDSELQKQDQPFF